MLEQRLGPMTRAAVTVLVVEDDDDMRELLVETLERDGYVVLSAGSIGEALLTIQRVARRVDLVLTDVRMSTGMASGIDFGHVLRESKARGTTTTPLILMTAFPDSAVYEAATSMNATVLSKPFRLDVLRREVLTRIAQHVKHPD
jgi:CheY-like chemotaxis protein